MKSSKSGKLPDIRKCLRHQHLGQPEGSLPTVSGNGIDTFVVVDVQFLFCGHPVSRDGPTDEPKTEQTSKRKENTNERKREIERLYQAEIFQKT